MSRRLFALLAAVSLILCVGRVGAWAAPTADAPACCHRPQGKTPPPSLTDCCPVPIATAPPRLHRVPAAALAVAAPRIPTQNIFVPFVESSRAPPGISTYRASPPARAPPLA